MRLLFCRLQWLSSQAAGVIRRAADGVVRSYFEPILSVVWRDSPIIDRLSIGTQALLGFGVAVAAVAPFIFISQCFDLVAGINSLRRARQDSLVDLVRLLIFPFAFYGWSRLLRRKLLRKGRRTWRK
jgi:uncharacterized membrane protein